MKKVIALFLAVIMIMAMFVGCSEKGKDSGKTPDDTKSSVEQTKEDSKSEETENQDTDPVVESSDQTETKPGRLSREEQVAIDFIKALLKKDYNTALTMMTPSGYEDSYVFVDDIEWAVNRSDYRDLEYFDPDSLEYTTSLSGSTVTVSLKDSAGETGEFKVYTEVDRNGDGNPTVNGENIFYCKDFSFRTADGVDVEINGAAVSKDHITVKNAGTLSIYNDWKVPFIGLKDKEIRQIGKVFDETVTVTPKSYSDPVNEEAYRLQPTYDNEEILTVMPQLLNNVFNAALAADAKVSDLYPYFIDTIDQNVVQTVFDDIRKFDEKDINFTRAVFNRETRSFWGTTDTLVLNFGYVVEFNSYGSHSMSRYSYILVANVDGEWKIAGVPEEKIFTWLNQFDHDF